MPFDQVGKLLIVLGAAILVIGLIIFLLGEAGFGRLPGDISFTAGNFTCIVPLLSMLVISLLLTLVVNVLLRIFNR